MLPHMNISKPKVFQRKSDNFLCPENLEDFRGYQLSFEFAYVYQRRQMCLAHSRHNFHISCFKQGLIRACPYL